MQGGRQRPPCAYSPSSASSSCPSRRAHAAPKSLGGNRSSSSSRPTRCELRRTHTPACFRRLQHSVRSPVCKPCSRCSDAPRAAGCTYGSPAAQRRDRLDTGSGDSAHVYALAPRGRLGIGACSRSTRDASYGAFASVVGKPSTPTPTGHFFVEEAGALRPQYVGAPYALALSARSNVLQEFEGGPGQIALHGTANVGGVLGTACRTGAFASTARR